nr:hypothetical protein [Methanoregulaceae archaeon]
MLMQGDAIITLGNPTDIKGMIWIIWEPTMDTDYGCFLGKIEQMIRYVIWSSGATGIVIGISGGIDSAVAAVM